MIAGLPRGTVTFLFTDIEGSTELSRRHLAAYPLPQRLFQIEAEGLRSDFPALSTKIRGGAIATVLAIDLVGWGRVLRELGDDGAAIAASEYHGIVSEIARANDGIEVERVADQSMCVFPSPRGAVVAVATIRDELRGRDWIHGTGKPELSAAVHTGRLAGIGAGQLGSVAFRVTTLCRSATPGQVLVSHSTQALLEGEILPGVELRDLGERDLPWMTPGRVYELIDRHGSRGLPESDAAAS